MSRIVCCHCYYSHAVLCAGDCNEADFSCSCDSDFHGAGCHVPRCKDDCNSRGVCAETLSGVRCTSCDAGWVGTACEAACFNGTENPLDATVCDCLSCYNGDSCNLLCNDIGSCANDVCTCPTSVVRYDPVCQQRGCPGIDFDCTGRGVCDLNSGECTCNPGFLGLGCETPVCISDCNSRGTCGVDALNRPRCLNCADTYMGVACADRCFNGTVSTNGDTCLCNNCFSGDDCGQICSGNGVCFDGETCSCTTDPLDSSNPGTGFTGDFCEEKSCPGLGGVPCSGVGTCNPASQTCTCDEGYQGRGCHEPKCLNDCNARGDCVPVADGLPECRNCAFGWMVSRWLSLSACLANLVLVHRGLTVQRLASTGAKSRWTLATACATTVSRVRSATQHAPAWEAARPTTLETIVIAILSSLVSSATSARSGAVRVCELFCAVFAHPAPP